MDHHFGLHLSALHKADTPHGDVKHLPEFLRVLAPLQFELEDLRLEQGVAHLVAPAQCPPRLAPEILPRAHLVEIAECDDRQDKDGTDRDWQRSSLAPDDAQAEQREDHRDGVESHQGALLRQPEPLESMMEVFIVRAEYRI